MQATVTLPPVKLLALLLAAAFPAAALSSTINVYADPGAAGAAGEDGTTGDVATAEAISVDAGNFAYAYGGAGGAGGDGSAESGGNGGDGGAGGSASASAGNLVPFASAGSEASATGGDGGQGGGADTGAFAGTGGAGGNATAASAVHAAGTDHWKVEAGSTATGGNGGLSASVAGAGGNATATASGDGTGGASLRIESTATGGAGGDGYGSANGGAGGNATASAFGFSDDGWVTVSAGQQGGAGGKAFGTGAGGAGVSSTLVDAASGSSSSHLGVSQAARGGAGGASRTSPGIAGDATSRLTLTNTGVGDLIAGSYAFGGDGGRLTDPVAISPGRTGGNALAALTAIGAANVTASASAWAGTGGAVDGGNAVGGTGGAVTLGTLYGQSTGGGTVQVSIWARAGKGGDAGGNATGGQGASIAITDAIDGATSGELSLDQHVTAGSGGAALNGLSGNGGHATSNLTKEGAFASLTVRSTAGAGGGGARSGPNGVGGAGGDASATARAVNTAGAANAVASAGGGAGGSRYPGYNASRNGPAGVSSAAAHATGTTAARAEATADMSSLANATSAGASSAFARAANPAAEATGGGFGNTTIAEVRTWGAGIGVTRARISGDIVNALETYADAQSANVIGPSIHAMAALGQISEFPLAFVASRRSFAAATGVPDAALYEPLLETNGNVAAAFDASGAEVVLLGWQGGFPDGLDSAIPTETIHTSVDVVFDTKTLGDSGNLLLGLLNPLYSGQGFDSLDFRVSIDGAPVETQTFTALSAALAYFDDHVIDLGPWVPADDELRLRIELDAFFAHDGERFVVTYSAANASPVPLPATSLLFLTAMAAVGLRLRRPGLRAQR